MRSGSAARSAWSAVLLVVGLLLAPLSVIAVRTTATLTDTDRFVGAFGPLADDPAVQDAVADATIAALGQVVSFDDLAAAVVADLTDRLSLPPAAAQGLGRLLDPIAASLRASAAGGVRSMASSDAFPDVWRGMLRGAHAQLEAALEGHPTGAVGFDEDTVVLRLGPVVEAAKRWLADQGVRAAALIPAVDRAVPLVELPGLSRAPGLYRAAGSLGYWLPALVAALLAGGVALAADRRRALVLGGFGLAAGMAALLVAVAVTGAALGRPGTTPAAEARAALRTSLFDAAAAPAVTAAAVLVVVGGTVGLVAWLTARVRPTPPAEAEAEPADAGPAEGAKEVR